MWLLFLKKAKSIYDWDEHNQVWIRNDNKDELENYIYRTPIKQYNVLTGKCHMYNYDGIDAREHPNNTDFYSRLPCNSKSNMFNQGY